MKKIPLIFAFSIFINFLFCQVSTVVEIAPLLKDQPFEIEKTYNLNGQPIQFDVLKFYLSHIQLLKGDEIVWQQEDSYHLIDISEPTSLKKPMDIPANLAFDQIQFQLGIDSVTHEAGAMGGDLDPTKGMYWGWNTGYINFKIEGTSPVCNSRNNAFQFHLGGYLSPFQTVRTIQLKVDKKDNLVLKMDIAQLMSQIDLSLQHKIMSPGTEAKRLSEIVSTIFICE